MKKRKIINVLLVSALLPMTACSQHDDVGDQSARQELLLTASQQTAVPETMTRAADGLYTAATGFDGDGTEQVRVFFNSTSSDFPVGRKDNSGVSTLHGGKLYYPVATRGIEPLYAVCPAASAEQYMHTVLYDQTTEENYKKSDLMYATTTVNLAENRQTSVHKLTFQHQMVKLKVIITKSSDIQQVTRVVVKNVYRCVPIVPKSTELQQIDPVSVEDQDNILVFSGEQTDDEAHTYCVLFPAQAWDYENFLEVTGDGRTISYRLTKDDWMPGHEYTMRVDVTAAYLGMSVIIADWQEDGTLFLLPEDKMALMYIPDQTYTGAPIVPNPIVVAYNNVILTEGTDYRLKFSNNTEVGTATVTAVGMNTYSGKTATITFNIVAAP